MMAINHSLTTMVVAGAVPGGLAHPTPRFGRSLGNELWKAGQKELSTAE